MSDPCALDRSPRLALALLVAVLLLLCCPRPLCAQNAPATQASQPQAEQAIEAAVHSELDAAKTDHSLWMYRDHDVTRGKDALYYAVETPQGELRRLIELNGQPLDDAARTAETNRIAGFVASRSQQARQRRNGVHDDDQATAMLKMLPQAYIWTVASETPEFITLNFRPNPSFNAPNIQSRVMGDMIGQMKITRDGNRIRTLQGKLSSEVKIGWGIFGELDKGGTFDVERRQVAPGHWEITVTDVHIGGHALLFKSIGQQEDETKTDWTPSTAHTLKEAEDILSNVR